MKTIELIIPNHFLSPLFNSDCSGLDDDDIKALDHMTDDMMTKYKCFHAINTRDDVGFLKYHDMEPYNVLAADCVTVIFDVGL